MVRCPPRDWQAASRVRRTNRIDPMSSDPCLLSATTLLEAYRKHELSPVEVTRAVLERIERLNPALNAFNLVSERALDDAKASEARWLAISSAPMSNCS